MTDFKRRFMIDKLLETLEYAAVHVTAEDVMREYITNGHIIVDSPIVLIMHVDTGFKVDGFRIYDIQAIEYDVETDHATIRLSIGGNNV